MFETAAICLYLADRFPEQRLAPPLGSPERAAYYQWVVYAVATLEPGAASGCPATRDGIDGLRRAAALGAHDDAWACAKAAFDPGGIIAPGRYVAGPAPVRRQKFESASGPALRV